MTFQARILARLDAGHEIGLGHAIRVSAILDKLKMPCCITVAGAGVLVADFFPAASVRPVSSEEPEEFFALVRESQPDLILVDHPRPGAGFWRALEACAGDIPVAAIDDEGGEVDADLIINGTVVDEYHNYPNLRSSARQLVGGDYALIRPVFEQTPWRNPAEASVTIVAGSGDRACEWALQLASGKMDLHSWGKVRMIVGRAFPEMAKLQHRCDVLGISLETGISGAGVAEALSGAAVALITGGMVVYESLAVGVPAVVFPQIENMIPEAEWFAAKGCITDLGYEGGMNVDLVECSVGRLLSASATRLVMSAAQRATIDGRGMLRAADAIDRLLARALAAS